MADRAQQTQTPAKAMPLPARANPSGMTLRMPTTPQPASSKAARAVVGVMSPVNQDGCFEFDRIIKAGSVAKRTRKTRSWKPIYLVLRPNCLSIYRDKDETQLRHQINLAEITAVARQRDSKKKVDHVFGIFMPARNYHLSARSDTEAQQWVDLIRREARIDEEEGDLTLVSPTGKTTFTGFDRERRNIINNPSSSSDIDRPTSSTVPETMHSARRPSHQALAYSGNDSVSDFDFSDTAGAFQASSASSLPRKVSQQKRNFSQQSHIAGDERVVCHGWLYLLKSKGGVRQWRRLWVVLRPKGLALYKTDDEYAASHIIPFSGIIDAVDIDGVSRSKQFCMQVISEEKNFRFCAPDEDALAKWLGAFKSLLIKRREAEGKRGAATASASANVGAQTPLQTIAQTPLKTIASPQIQPPTPTPTQQPLALN